jgi:TolA-binding protein
LAKLTRKELKSDRFQLEVQHGVTFVAHHQRQLIRWGGIAAAVLIVGFGIYFYASHEATVRGEALHQALLINNAPVGAPPNEYQIGFPTQAEHDKAAEKAFKDLAAKYPGTQEGLIAEYYLGISGADQGNSADAEKRFKSVIDSAKPGLASLAKLSLAQVYGAEGKTAEAESLLRGIMDKPTELVSKETATFTLARLLQKTKPDEARKLVEPFRGSQRPNLSRAAITFLGELQQQK